MSARYITTTIPYVNADPHIGFALELIQADVLARAWRLQGYKVTFNTGTDEHGQKIYQKALEEKMSPQVYCDTYAAKFDSLKKALNVSYTQFIRTTDPHHKSAAQEFWKRCMKKGDIYKKNYQTKYCVGCELEKTDSELVENKCPIHPNKEIEFREEENYFFRFSRYQQQLFDLYTQNLQFVIPQFRLNEISQFVSAGLQDFSISRLKIKMPWGVEVPGDSEHVMYVWFDALINYISTLGWPENEENFNKNWPGVQIAGKDNLRQQSAMWQAMLLSADLPVSKQIIIHGFITSNGQKMSKSLGNVIDPFVLVQTYGVDAVRYYLLKEIPTLNDGDFSFERMQELYTTDLANELGNSVSRITTLAQTDTIEMFSPDMMNEQLQNDFVQIETMQLNKVLTTIWNEIKQINNDINENEPWNKTKEDRHNFLVQTIKRITLVGYRLRPFLPETAQSIITSTQGSITKAKQLFPRLSK